MKCFDYKTKAYLFNAVPDLERIEKSQENFRLRVFDCESSIGAKSRGASCRRRWTVGAAPGTERTWSLRDRTLTSLNEN